MGRKKPDHKICGLCGLWCVDDPAEVSRHHADTCSRHPDNRAATTRPKKAKKTKPIPATRLTLDECERRGWIAAVVEQTIPHTFIKRDLFGVIDIVAVTPGGIVGIQATSGTNLHGRRAKILAEHRMALWLNAGAKLELWTWERRAMPPLLPSRREIPIRDAQVVRESVKDNCVYVLRVESYGATSDDTLHVEDAS